MIAVSQAAIIQKLALSNRYTTNNSQELVTKGVVNLFGPCVGGYLTMGSFSSSTILSMAEACFKILTVDVMNRTTDKSGLVQSCRALSW